MWLDKISQNLSQIPEFIEYFENELIAHRNDVKISGNLEKQLSSLPGITETVFCKLQEIEAVLKYLNIQLEKTKSDYFKKYLENYNKVLSSRDCEKYVDGESEVVDFQILINQVALIRNKYLGICKGLESKNYMLGHIRNLRTAGMENISI